MTDNDEPEYPAVDAAFEFVVPSYQIMAGRFEAADTRLNSLTTTLLTMTTAVPIFTKAINPAVSFVSGAFAVGLIAAGVGLTLGVLGRNTGKLTVVDPMVIYRKSLWRAEPSFKKNAIGFAGQHFDENAKAIEQKGTFATGMVIAMVAELLAFALWVSLWT
jgi:hypothetical protein